MSPLLRPFYPLPNASDLHVLEIALGFTLPDGYRAFLRDYNGGILLPPEISDDAELGFYAPLAPSDGRVPNEFWSVALFHGLLRQPHQYGDLREIYPVMRDEWNHPRELLPIASMAGNGKYFLCIAGSRRGRVLVAGTAYIERLDADQPATPDDYHEVAESFEGLLQRLVWRPS